MTKGFFQYRAYGLNIHSDHPIQSFMKHQSENADVIIERGNIDKRLAHIRWDTQFRNWRASKNYFLLEVDAIAKYLVENGSIIWIDPYENTTEDDIAAFLLGSTFAALLQQRKVLTLHASAVQTFNGAALFLGPSGVGKSTTLSALMARGYNMITDDVSALIADKHYSFQIQPGFPTTRLWGDALEKLGLSPHDGRQLRAELDKYLIPVDQFCQSPKKVEKIFLLDVNNKSHIEIEPLLFSESIQYLTRFTFRKNFYRGLELDQFHFETVSRLAKSTPVIKVSRPEHLIKIDELVQNIHDMIEE